MDRPAGTLWRPSQFCEDYWSEYKHCISFENRFHQFYAYGTFQSCRQWKEDYSNCKKWEKHRSLEAKDALLMSERNRLAEQKKFTPVWEMRQTPPRDWHMPLNQDKPQDV